MTVGKFSLTFPITKKTSSELDILFELREGSIVFESDLITWGKHLSIVLFFAAINK